MKPVIGTVVATMVVSVAIWLVFYFVINPGQPLEGSETTVVVGVSLLLVVAARWIVQKRKRGDS